jgi:CcmD family protein
MTWMPQNRNRHLLAALLLVAALAGSPTTMLAQQQPRQPPAQDEFVPVSEIPESDQLPAAPLLIAAYAAAWLIIVFYVWSLWRRLGRVEQELRTLSARGPREM